MPDDALAPAPGPDGDGNVMVLIVEDQPALRKSLVRILRSRGYNAEAVESGEAALAALMTLGMDGFEVLRRLKELRPKLAVIMMTAMAEVGIGVRAVEAGAYHFLTK